MTEKARRAAAREVEKLAKLIGKGRVATYAVMVVTVDGKVEASLGVSSDGVVSHHTVHGAAMGLRDVLTGLSEGFRAVSVGHACESFARLHGAALTLLPQEPAKEPRRATQIAAKAIAKKAIRKAKRRR